MGTLDAQISGLASCSASSRSAQALAKPILVKASTRSRAVMALIYPSSHNANTLRMNASIKEKVNSFCSSQSLLKSSSSHALIFQQKYAEIGLARMSLPEFRVKSDVLIDKYINLSVSESEGDEPERE